MKYFLLINLFFLEFISIAQVTIEVKGNYYLQNGQDCQIEFHIKNLSDEDIWINTHCLQMALMIQDSTGNIPPKRIFSDRNIRSAEFILVPKKERVVIKEKAYFSDYYFKENMIYYYIPVYKCDIKFRKRKTKMKTLIGIVPIKPYKFKIIE